MDWDNEKYSPAGKWIMFRVAYGALWWGWWGYLVGKIAWRLGKQLWRTPWGKISDAGENRTGGVSSPGVSQ